MPEVSEAFLQQFVEGLQASAAAQSASASAMNAVAAEMKEQTREARDGRAEAVNEINAHADLLARNSNRWPNIWLGLLTVAATLAVALLAFIATARK